MASQAIPGYGTLLKRGASAGYLPASQNFTTLGEVKSIDGPSTKVSVIDVTTHSSAASGNYMEKIASLIDPGEVTADLNWVPSDTTHQNLRTDLTSRTKRAWCLALPSPASANVVFDGYVTDFPLSFPVDDVIGGSITITISGPITIIN